MVFLPTAHLGVCSGSAVNSVAGGTAHHTHMHSVNVPLVFMGWQGTHTICNMGVCAFSQSLQCSN